MQSLQDPFGHLLSLRDNLTDAWVTLDRPTLDFFYNRIDAQEKTILDVCFLFGSKLQIGKRAKCFLGMVCFLLSFCVSHGQVRTQSTPDISFAFWYEPWQPGATIRKLEPANVIIGVPLNALPEIHKAGKRGLQYVTYYQSGFGTEFLKNDADLNNVGFKSSKAYDQSAFGGRDNYVLCPNSIELRARITRFLDASLKAGVDGYFIDNTFLDPPAHEVCNAPHSHIKQDTLGGRAYVDLLAAVRERMRQQNPRAILIANPGSPAWSDKIAEGKPSLWDVSDYVVWESYGYTSHAGWQHNRWKETIEQSFLYSASADKAPKLLALSYPKSAEEAQFAFSVAKVFGFAWAANLGENQEGKNQDGGHFGLFLKLTPADLGDPVNSLTERSSRLLHRKFTHGEIFVNVGQSTEQISITSEAIVYIGGNAPVKMGPHVETLPPMTAAIAVKTH
ncbi:MAG TPA: hypothetical protein VKH81_04310 [Candidatus Angelobacter sp.]|nr:hypothetical protein [Candidatus Angelobacter sp.]